MAAAWRVWLRVPGGDAGAPDAVTTARGGSTSREIYYPRPNLAGHDDLAKALDAAIKG